ncbi:tudor domain-containing protein 7A [Antennarius striatus]|uniref:tudor domain-containing protein 7A n=1 Tax=Antennarius striatus TaxID=241820 RepID=UPI0035ADF226
MSDSESIKKMLRSVLQSIKGGVPLSSLMSEYRSLCGENIPLKKLGFSNLEDYVRSIPSVVRMENHMGELRCFAALCKETAHIAELVAKQKCSKKSGRSQVINCSWRFKRSDPYMLNVKPRSSLRQPSSGDASKWIGARSLTRGGSSASGDYRQLDQKLSSVTPVEHRIPPSQPTLKEPERRKRGSVKGKKKKPQESHSEEISRLNQSESSSYNVELVQSRMTQLLKKYCSGLWMSKISKLYSTEFNEQLPSQVLNDLERWTRICVVEKPSSNLRNDCLIYPPLPASAILCRPAHCSAVAPQLPPCVNLVVNTNVNCKVSHSLPAARVDHKQKFKTQGPTWTPPESTKAPPLPSSYKLGPDNLTISSSSSNFAHGAPLSPSPVVLAEVRSRIKELLAKCSRGLWASALPKLYMDMYKTSFPECILDNLSLLLDICNVEYVTTRDKTKAILYYTGEGDMEATGDQEIQQHGLSYLPSGLEVVGCEVPPCLVSPTEQYPSVLVTDATSSNTVTVRYVGENYSDRQEAMEDTMLSFYNQNPALCPISDLVVGQLVAVREQDDDITRAQVINIMAPDKVKLYYVDHGSSVTTSMTNLLELHQDFLSLPFQATSVRLAGLEAFGSHPLLLSSLDDLAVGKVLLMETIKPRQQDEMPVVVLYDTSQDDELIINTACLMTLQDKSMNNPLAVNATFSGVSVTNVSPDGIICCQLPSRGTVRLRKLLEKTEAVFMSQMTSHCLVSRPFTGKFCLARFKGKWSRAEITNMHGNRVMELLFIDFGVPATVEVTELREIPPGLLKEFTVIPPQATKCRLADVSNSEGDWSPDIILWVKDRILGRENCNIKVMKLDKHKDQRLAYVHLFIDNDGKELHRSINHQLSQLTMWQNFTTQNNNNTIVYHPVESTLMEKLTLGSLVPQPAIRAPTQQPPGLTSQSEAQPLPMPPPLEPPKPGESMDVFVPSACHPGHFVLQQWKEIPKLEVLMGEMILYYNQTWMTNTPPHIDKGEVYAARIDKNWHRVEVKRILANGLVSVYELDHGKNELVPSSLFQPLIEEFRHLPFQAIAAQLAGVTQHRWSDAASMVFRKRVEDRALVAQVVSVQEVCEAERELQVPKMTVYLVDTSSADVDVWIHSIMADNVSGAQKNS